MGRKRTEDDDDSDEDDAMAERKPLKMAGNTQKNRADHDKNCPRIIHTIMGGPPAWSRLNSGLILGSSSKGKGKEICQVEHKRLKVDNTTVFTDEDFDGIETPPQDALVVLAWIGAWKIERFMIDAKSSADILFNVCYEKMRSVLKAGLKSYDHDLFGFDGRSVKPWVLLNFLYSWVMVKIM